MKLIASLFAALILLLTAATPLLAQDQAAATCPSGEVGAVSTAVGCAPYTSIEAFRDFWITRGLGIAGGVAFIMIILAGYQLLTSRGDPDRVASARNLVTAAVSGLLLLLFIPLIIRYASVDILGILPRFL